MKHRDCCLSPLGKIIIVSDESHLLFLGFEGQRYLDEKMLEEVEEKETSISLLVKEWLEGYFKGERPDVSIPLSISDLSSFRQKVLGIMMKIPYGETRTYKDIALEMERETGKKVSCQSVGGAVGHNPISIIIPCHRVIGSNGSLVGYAGGVERKKALLSLEGVKGVKE